MMCFRFTIFFVFVAVFACVSHAQHLKVDISTTGQSRGHAPDFTQWIMPINSGSVQSATFGSLKMKLNMTSPPADATHYMKCQYANKDGQTYNFKLSYDGVWPHWKDEAKSVDMPYPNGGALTLTITGLSTGPHNIITYHNNPYPKSKTWRAEGTTYTSEVSDCIVSVNGVYDTTATPTVDNRNDATCGYAFFTINAVAGTPVVISFTPAHNRSMDNVFLNGFEIDAPGDPAAIALEPVPTNGDMHVDVNNDDPATGEESKGYTTLSWKPSASAVSHNVYLGTNETDVLNATTETESVFKGNQTDTTYLATGLSALSTYYWRIDEVNVAGTATKGEVWSFTPRRIAFPGAEGWGRFSHGGRGGRVIHVTNLNDNGPGSLRAAVDAEGPRTIVFDVSGLIKLKSRLIIKNPYCTVAGQTAPGKGICIGDYDFGTQGGSDFIIRYVRVRVGKEAGTSKTLGGMGMASTDHSIIDHCSISWSQDEAFSSRQAGNITLQRTLISEALHVAGHNNYPAGSSHGFAASIGGKVGSFHHNLLAHCEGRNWSLAGGLDPSNRHTGSLDIRNNVVYNWDGRTTDGGAQYVNFVRNYYKPGPATTNGPFTELNPQFEHPAFGPQQYYVEGNVMEDHHGPEGPLPPFEGVKPQGTQSAPVTVPEPFFEHYVSTQTAADAYENVLNDVGCNFPMLDDHDTRIINETRNGTFTYRGSVTGRPGLPDNQEDVGGWEDYPEIHRPDDFDTDQDGMPDSWETANGLNPNDPEDRNGVGEGGYTNLENYLNSMVSYPTGVKESEGFVPIEFTLDQNYPNPFNPTTNIQFQIPKDGHVTVSVYNTLGQQVATLLDEELKSGSHHVTFDATKFASGIYFYRIKAGDFTKVRKMMLLR